ncbi:hypothetical protein [Streptomyces sp. NPDC015414]|uniref:hypothetical protein n=1 Tax=Streptomyces sp. NPDC015414 TaxID=3364957 RepID=UPI0036FEFFD7
MAADDAGVRMAGAPELLRHAHGRRESSGVRGTPLIPVAPHGPAVAPGPETSPIALDGR